MLLLFIIAALSIAILAVVFAIQNASILLISFLVWQFQGSMALILLVTFALGFVAGSLIILPEFIKKSFMISGQKKKLEESKKILEEKDAPKITTMQEQKLDESSKHKE